VLPVHHPILLALLASPLTDLELGIQIGKNNDTTRMHRVQLVYLGRVQSSQTRRKNPSGKTSTVWELTALGITKARTLKKRRTS
jgi:hypothetical protein